MKNKPLLPMITRLRMCASQDACISRELLIESWTALKCEAIGQTPSAAILAALVLSDDRFTDLLSAEQNMQLEKLARTALEKYQQITNPPNKLGKLILGNIKKQEET